MKKTGTIIWLSMVVVFIISTAFISFQSNPVQNPNPEEGFAIPEDVNQIFEKSCFGCHNVEASSDKAKKKLLIDQLGDLSIAKLVGKLGAIEEALEEKEMPPEKFLAKYPDKALTDGETKRLMEWASKTAEDLMK